MIEYCEIRIKIGPLEEFVLKTPLMSALGTPLHYEDYIEGPFLGEDLRRVADQMRQTYKDHLKVKVER